MPTTDANQHTAIYFFQQLKLDGNVCWFKFLKMAQVLLFNCYRIWVGNIPILSLEGLRTSSL